MPRILFILKRKEDFNPNIDKHIGVTTGLYNSASFVNEMLLNNGVRSELVVVKDNNDIDREVTRYKPTHVVIEALWVVPTKFAILQKLHPDVKWIIRLHSEMPFMAGEGIAFDWLGDYSKFKNIIIGVNAPRMMDEVSTYLKLVNNWTDEETSNKIIYLPNYYPTQYKTKPYVVDNKKWIDVGCFGAVRLLKNHMVQAVAAIKFAESLNKGLRFHINSSRLEMQGQPVLHNLMGMFQHLHNSGHELITHSWVHREEFLKVCAEMDIGMQVNFSETFNIVGADLVSQGVPFIGTEEIPWASKDFSAKPAFSDDIFNKLKLLHRKANQNVAAHQKLLTKYSNKTEQIWLNYFKGK